MLQVHDELLVEAPDAEVSTVKELVREEMCSAYPLDPPLAVDVGAGDDWNEAKYEQPESVRTADASGSEVRHEARRPCRKLFDQLLRLLEQGRELAELGARHLDRDAHRRARGRRERERLLAVAHERRQLEILVAPGRQLRAGDEALVGAPQPVARARPG